MGTRILAGSHEFEIFGVEFSLRGWGVFFGEDGQRHVAPCTLEGELLEPHQLDWHCPCKPEFDQGVCSHRVVERSN
jgi:hypothetical protein